MRSYPLPAYGRWAGNPHGQPYNENKCAYEVCGSGRFMIFHQCSRSRNGEDLFCKQHRKMVDRHEKEYERRKRTK